MALDADTLAAIRKYGPQINNMAESRYGVSGEALLAKLITGESGGSANAVSPVGARGRSQFMPGSRQIAIDKYGVDPWADADQAVHGAVLHLQGKISGSKGLEGYNPGMPTYAQYILGQKVGNVRGNAPRPSSAGGSSSAPSSSMAPIPGVPQIEDGGQAGDFTSLLASLIRPQQQAPTMMPIAPPQFSGQQALPQGFRPLTPEVQQQAPAQGGVSSTLGLLEGLRGSGPTLSLPEIAGATGGVSIAEKVQSERKLPRGLVPLGGSKNAGDGVFKIEGPSPDRLQKPLVKFAEQVAAIYGGELQGKDGSTHSKYTVNGNVSDHYAGNATDIFFIDGRPAEGERLIRAGRAALIAAGMPRAQALKAKGGLYNVGGHQVIFGVSGKQYGGNHLDHLHISAH